MIKLKALPKSVMLSCFIAGGLEMYDFLIFGFLSSIIHKNYLSFLDATNALIVTYGLFAVGFIFRPLGSIIFGQIGDKRGRKVALIMSVSFMGMASLSMSLLPTYQAIGITSCYAIVLIRIIQGISVGGEYSGAIIYAIEHVNKNNVGIVGATVLSGCVSGVMLAFVVSKILQTEWLPEYSWRFAFLLGSGLSFVGYFIRRNLKESPIFQNNKISVSKVPLLSGIKSQWLKMVAVILLAGTSNANFYFAVVFVPNYLSNYYSEANSFSGLFLVTSMFFLIPVVGWLLDKFDRNKVMLISCLLIAIYDLVFLPLLSNSMSLQIVMMITIGYAVLLSFVFVVVNIFVLEVFPPECRFSCGATSYSIGAALLGGTAPMICSLLVKSYENHLFYLGGYISLLSILGVLGSVMMFFALRKKTKHYVTKGVAGSVVERN
jgi:MFS transporter, MHS family, proline/betaine transporter